MIVLVAVGLLLLGVMIGGAGMRRAGLWTRRVTGPWRPGVGVAALICVFGGVALVARGAVIEGAALAAVGLLLALGARRRPIRATEMSPDQARRILGVEPSADRAAVEAAYRRLMQRAHPDLGGSSGLAAELNAARAALTK